jgi:hypothetical protein
MKFEIVFTAYGDTETIVKQKFDSFKEADQWANDKEYNYQDIAIDDDGNDYWKTFYRFYNPEDNDNYCHYEIRECTEEL